MESVDRMDFTDFVTARSGELLRSAAFLCGGDDAHRAEDLLQTALGRAYLAWPRINAQDPERYVRRILVNLATDWWRSPLSRVRPSPTPLADIPDPASAEDRLADRDVLNRALDRLSPRERAALVCRFYWDLSEQQTAAQLGWPAGR